MSPALSRYSGDRARVATRVPGDSATGNEDCADLGEVPESPARVGDTHQNINVRL